VASSSLIVSTTTPVCGLSAVICRVASMPFSSGICTSITTTSGWSSIASSTACRPSAAVPTTSTPATDDSSADSPSRYTG